MGGRALGLTLLLLVLLVLLLSPYTGASASSSQGPVELVQASEGIRTGHMALAAGVPAPTTTIEGNWEVTGEEVRQDEVIWLKGNLTVKSGGNLTFLNVTLVMDCSRPGEFGITVETGAEMNVLDGSSITSPRANYWFHVQAGASFRMEDSALAKCGCTGQPGVPPGLLIEASNTLVENATITDCPYGLYVQNAWGVVVRNCTFKEMERAAIYCYDTDELLVEGNNVNGTVVPVVGWAFPSFADGIVVRNSENITIRDNMVTRCGAFYGGVAVWNAHNVTVLHNNVTYSGGYGISIVSCHDVDVGLNYVAYNGGDGIILSDSQDGTIYNNTIVHDGLVLSGSDVSHYIHTVENNTVNGRPLFYGHALAGGSVPTDVGEAILVDCDYMSVENLTISYTDVAVELAYCYSTTIWNLTVSDAGGILAAYCESMSVEASEFVNGTDGIYLDRCDDVSITGCNFTGQSVSGIRTFEGDGLSIIDCSLANTSWAVDLFATANVLIRDNVFAGSDYAVIALHVTNFTARDNVFDHNRWGLILDCTSGFGPLKEVIVRDNVFYQDGVFLEGTDDDDFVIDVFENNMVNGKPIYYVINETGYTAPSDAGSLIIVNSTSITVDGLNLSYTDVGVELAFCSDVTIEGLVAVGNVHAIHLYYVEDVEVRDCEINDNYEVAIYMAWANHTAVLDNELTGNGPTDVMPFLGPMTPYGGVIVDHTALNITISGNTLANSTIGVAVLVSFPITPAGDISDVRIRDNAILNNTVGIYVANFLGASSGALSDLLVEGNAIGENDYYGVYLWGCQDAMVANNTFFNNTAPSGFGPWILAGGGHGLLAYECLGTGIANNTFSYDGVLLGGSEVEHFVVDPFYNNTVNGKPIYYALNEADYVAPSDAGSVIVVNSTGVELVALNLSYTDVGVELAFCSDVTINQTVLAHDNYGLYALFSNHTEVLDANVSQNWEGVSLDHCVNITISGCSVGQNVIGVDMGSTENATIILSQVAWNLLYGISASSTSLRVLNSSIIYNGPPFGQPPGPIGIGIVCTECPVADIHYNNIYSNTAFGLYASDCMVNATYNWWNSTTGPEYTPMPDAVDPEEVFASDGLVLYEPWLMEPWAPEDTVPPDVEITAPSDGAYLRGEVQVNASATDDRGVERVEFYINDTLVHTDYDAPYTYEWDTTAWADGSYVVNATAYDTSGNANSTSITVVVDNTEPEGQILAPEDGSHVRGVVTINVSGSDANLEVIELYINDTLVASWSSSGTHTYEWDTTAWDEGSYEIELVVVDLAGNVFHEAITVIVDNTPPEGSILSPSDGAYVRGVVTINVTGGDAHLEVIELYVDDTLVASWDANGTYSYAWNTTSWSDGAHTIRLVVRDLAGNTWEEVITVIVDNTEPEGEITTPSEGSFLKGLVQVNVTGEDDHLHEIRLYINGTLVATWMAPGAHIYEWDTRAWQDGAYLLELVVDDLAGNTHTLSVLVVVDNTRPEGSILSLSEGAYLRGMVDVDVVGVDENIEAVELYINDTLVASWSSSGTHTYEWDTTAWDDGAYIIKLVVRDLAGNTHEETVAITVDNTPPEARIEEPEDGAYVSGTTTITVWAEDAHLSSVELYIDGVLVASWGPGSTHTYEWDTTALADGLHTISLLVRDMAGNTREASARVTVDNTEPVIESINYEPSEPMGGEEITIRVAASDALSGVKSVVLWYRAGGGEWTAIQMEQQGGAWVATIPGQPAGTTVEFYVEVEDGAGNTARSDTLRCQVVMLKTWHIIAIAGGIGVAVAAAAVLFLRRRG